MSEEIKAVTPEVTESVVSAPVEEAKELVNYGVKASKSIDPKVLIAGGVGLAAAVGLGYIGYKVIKAKKKESKKVIVEE